MKVTTVKTFHIEIAVLAMMVLGGTFLSGNEAEGIGIEQLVVPIPTSEQSMTPDGTESIEVERLYGVFKYKELFCPPELCTTPEGKQYHVFTKAQYLRDRQGKRYPYDNYESIVIQQDCFRKRWSEFKNPIYTTLEIGGESLVVPPDWLRDSYICTDFLGYPVPKRMFKEVLYIKADEKHIGVVIEALNYNQIVIKDGIYFLLYERME